MSTISIAKRDFLDVRRARLVWGPVVLYTLFMLLFFWGQSSAEDPNFYQIMWSLLGLGGALVIPLIALVAAYLSVAGERESGSIKFTLSAPVKRSSVVFGKLISRTAIVVAGILVSFVVGTLAGMVLVPDMTFEWGDYLIFIAVTLLYALAYVSVAVGISAATGSRSRAIGGSIGFFFLFNLVWNFLPVQPTEMLRFLLEEFGRDPDNYQNLLEFVFSISPTGAYLNSTKLFMTDEFLELVGTAGQSADPFYIQGWFMLVILSFWVVAPLAVGYWQFNNAQLG